MYPIKAVRQITFYSPIEQQNIIRNRNVCIAPNGKEMVSHADGFYYVAKDGKTLTRKRVKL